MTPSSFGANPLRSTIPAFHLKVSTTHKPVHFAGGNEPQVMNFNQLGDKELFYMPPPALLNLLEKQNRSKVRTDDDLSEMTHQDWYLRSSAGQKYLAWHRRDRAKVLASIGIGHKRTDLVHYFSKDQPNIDDAGLIRKILLMLAKQNQGITHKKLIDNVARFMYYTPDETFDPPGIRLGNEGDPPVHETPVGTEKPLDPKEIRKARTKNLSIWKAKTRVNPRQPGRTIVEHGTGLSPLTTRTTIYRRQRTDLRSLPAKRPVPMLEEITAQNPPGLIYRSRVGYKSAKKNWDKRLQGLFTPLESLVTGMINYSAEQIRALTPLNHEVAKSQPTPFHLSSEVLSTSVPEIAPAKEATSLSTPTSQKPSSIRSNPKRTKRKHRGTLDHSKSAPIIFKDSNESAQIESTLTSQASSRVPLSSMSANRSPIRTTSDLGPTKDGGVTKAGKSYSTYRKPELNRSASTPILEEASKLHMRVPRLLTLETR